MIKIYATETCPYCVMAKKLLTSKKLSFCSLDASSPEVWRQMQQESGRNTVPQIFIGKSHIGGYDDLNAANNSGKLDEIILREQTND